MTIIMVSHACSVLASIFDKLVQYGEVPWIDKVFNEAEDPDLYNPRDTRDVIIGHILEDLDYAYTNILEEDVTHNSTIVNKWTAAAFKSRVCLFEAAWRNTMPLTNWISLVRDVRNIRPKIYIN